MYSFYLKLKQLTSVDMIQLHRVKKRIANMNNISNVNIISSILEL